MIRVFIVASSPLAQSALETMLASRGFSLAGTSRDLEELIARIADVSFDALVIDSSGETSRVLETLAASEVASEVPVVLLGESSFAEFAGDAIRAGVRGVLRTDASAEQLEAAIRAAIEGLVVVNSVEAESLLPAAAPVSRAVDSVLEPLTPREREVLQMLAGGQGNKQIAAKLSLSEHTVKFHVASILGKLGASSRTEAVAIGIRQGLVLL